MALGLLYPKLSYQIVGICFETHNELGRFARERQYANLISSKLKEKGLNFQRELQVSGSGNVLDFLIDDKIVLELKNKDLITKTDYFQVQRYLHSAGIKLGILINFRNKFLRPKRIVITTKRLKDLD